MPPGTVTDVALRVSSTAGRRPGAAASKRLTVLLDAAPLSAAPFTAGILRSSDQVLLLGTMSALLEHVPASSVRLVVFNLEQQKELFRRDGFAPESLNEVAQTLNQLQLAKVDYQTLLNRTGHIDLLATLINRELRAEPRSDIVVFLGPRERFHDNFPDGVLDKRRGSAPRFFFLAYQVPVPLEGIAHSGERDVSFGGIEVSDNPRDERALRRSSDIIVTTPPEGLPDTLSKAIGKVKGKTMTIESPRQFAKAIKEIVGRAGR